MGISRRTAGMRSLAMLAGIIAASALSAPAAFASEAIPDPLAAHASSAPVIAASELGQHTPAGFYRIRRSSDAPTRLQNTVTVYWMPKGSAGRAPAQIKATPAYRDSLPAELASSDVVIYGPEAIGFQNSDDVTVQAFCPSWFCVFEHRGFNGDKRRFRSNYWQHLSNYGFNDKTSSVKNRTGWDTKLSEHIYCCRNGNSWPGGIVRCYDSYTNVSYVGDRFNDKASGVKVLRRDNAC